MMSSIVPLGAEGVATHHSHSDSVWRIDSSTPQQPRKGETNHGQFDAIEGYPC